MKIPRGITLSVLSLFVACALGAGSASAGSYSVSYGETASPFDANWTTTGGSALWDRTSDWVTDVGPGIYNNASHSWIYTKPAGLSWESIEIAVHVAGGTDCSQIRQARGPDITSSVNGGVVTLDSNGDAVIQVENPKEFGQSIGRFWRCPDAPSGPRPMTVESFSFTLSDFGPPIATVVGLPTTETDGHRFRASQDLTLQVTWSDAESGLDSAYLRPSASTPYPGGDAPSSFYEWSAEGEGQNASRPGVASHLESMTITPPVESGRYYYRAGGVDASGNDTFIYDDSPSFHIDWDLVAPEIASFGLYGSAEGLTDGVVLEEAEPVVETIITDPEGNLEASTATIDGEPADLTNPSGEVFSVQPSSPLSNGDHTLRVQAVDRAGNITARALEFEIDAASEEPGPPDDPPDDPSGNPPGDTPDDPIGDPPGDSVPPVTIAPPGEAHPHPKPACLAASKKVRNAAAGLKRARKTLKRAGTRSRKLRTARAQRTVRRAKKTVKLKQRKLKSARLKARKCRA